MRTRQTLVAKWVEARDKRLQPPDTTKWEGTALDASDRFGLRELRTPPVGQYGPSVRLVVGALDDLAVSLDLPPEELGLGRTLAVEWLAGDLNSSGPEFDPRDVTIRLTPRRKADVGALAHEWFHAFDHAALVRVLV